MRRNGTMKKLFNLAAAALVAAPLAFSTGAALAQDKDTAGKTATPQISAVNDQDNVTYINPWVLSGALVLPLLLLLMKMRPPAPTSVPYAPVKLLKNVRRNEESPEQVPWWLRQLRLTTAAFAIVALAHPLINPEEPLKGEGPLLLVVDNGWASAGNWQARVAAMNTLIDKAERESRSVVILTTAKNSTDNPVLASGQLSPGEARGLANTLEPQPWPVDRQGAIRALDEIQASAASVIWLSNGLEDANAAALADRLKRFGNLTVFVDPAGDTPHLLVPPDHKGGKLGVTVKRLQPSDVPETLTLAARAEDGRVVHRIEARFEPGQKETVATFDLPLELRDELTQIVIEGKNTAGATLLLEDRWRPVGLVDDSAPEAARGLLGKFQYVEEALRPYVDLRRGQVEDLLARELSVMVMAHDTALDRESYQKIDDWIRAGGTVLRFAGPALAQGEDNLLPVRLRPGERTFGGAMSLSRPTRIAPFDQSSPFHGLSIPDDIVIEKQVLAQPGIEATERTWARLEDGTPLITAEKRGEGWLVLVHTTANREWSNLVLSGFFVDMLRTVVAHSQGIEPGANGPQTLGPLQTLDARGRLTAPSPAAQPLSMENFGAGTIGPRTPPGFYGNDTVKRAHNLAASQPDLEPLKSLPEGAAQKTYGPGDEIDLKPWLLGGAAGLFLLDTLVMLGHRRRREKTETAQKPAAIIAPKP